MRLTASLLIAKDYFSFFGDFRSVDAGKDDREEAKDHLKESYQSFLDALSDLKDSLDN